MGKSILFISLGHGTAHARRDMVLADFLSELDGSVQIKFVSYADGYKSLSAKGRTCVNIGLSKNGDEHDRLIKMGEAMREEKPDLVLSDEELLALPLAKLFQIPSLLITNWFPPGFEHPSWRYFADPEAIIFPSLEEEFVVPSGIKPPVNFVGPILPSYDGSPEKRKRFREELGILSSSKLILVTSGQPEESDGDFFRRSVEAFKSFEGDAKLIMVVGELKEELEQEIKIDSTISLREYLWKPDKYMLASDLVINRGGYFTLWELASMGIPSVCVPRNAGDFHVQNLIYARNMEKYGASVVVFEEDLKGEKLTEQMNTILFSQDKWEEMSNAGLRICQKRGEKRAAEIILQKGGD